MGRKKNFEREADVRKWWREEGARIGEYDVTLWIEPRSGATFGVPDILYPVDGRLQLVELKLGEFSDGWIQIVLRRAQADVWRMLQRRGVEVLCLVGVKNSRRTLVCDAFDIITGKTKTYVEITRIEELKGMMEAKADKVPSSTFSQLRRL